MSTMGKGGSMSVPSWWEHECTEFTRHAMRENRKAYRDAGYEPKIIRKRIQKHTLEPHQLAEILRLQARRI